MAFFKVSIRNLEYSSIFITAACLKFFYLSPNFLCVRLYVLPCWYFTVVQTSFNTGDCVNMDVSVSMWEREHPPKTSPESLSVVPCAIFCWSGATQHPNKCPETLGINHSFQPTSYLGCFPEMSLFLLCMFSFQSPAVQNHYNHHCCPRQAFFFYGFISTAGGDYWQKFSHSSWKPTQVSHCLWAWASQPESLSSDKDRKKNLVLRTWEEHLSQCLILYCKDDMRSLAHTRCKISHIFSSFYKRKKKYTQWLSWFSVYPCIELFFFHQRMSCLVMWLCGISHQNGWVGQQQGHTEMGRSWGKSRLP